MADLIKKIKIKKQDGTFTDYIPIGAEAQNISTSDGDSVQLKLGKKPYYYDTVADMKADMKLKAGDMVVTLGYYEVNDGGGATYKITDEESETEYQEELDSGLYTTLITNKKINALQLGIKRNIEEDQSSKVNSILSLPMKKIIYFPSGKYYFENGIINNNRHDIIGDVNTVTDYDRNINGTRFYFTNLENNTILLDCSSGSRCSIRDIYIVCDNVEITQDRGLISDGTIPVDIFSKTTKNTGIIGLKFGNYGNQVINVSIYGCNTGLILNTYNTIENVGILSCEIGIETKNDNQMSNLNIQRCETGIILKGALNNLNQIRMDSIRYYGLVIETGATSNNISNFIADICQYGAIEMIGTQGNYISGNIGRTGTYYANFTPSNVTEPEKACKIYMRNGCTNNKIDIVASRSNLTDTTLITKYAPAFTFVFGVSESNNKYNDLSVVGQPLATEITPNNVLTLEQLNQIIKFTGQISGSLNFQGKTYIFNNANVELTQYNVYVIKPIRYDYDYATLSNGNLNMSSNNITNVGELRFGNSTNGWAVISKDSSTGGVKVQKMNTSYVRSDTEITGLTIPTTDSSATNKNYVDNL